MTSRALSLALNALSLTQQLVAELSAGGTPDLTPVTFSRTDITFARTDITFATDNA